ncbi:MAG: SsrA-binding protein SmpB [Candidatus Omnitrophica bacterium]|jgi:SsrA-binding protein|nr:SsrA-binding protein SmpB [Candidatus Omnitrophota bacterium]
MENKLIATNKKAAHAYDIIEKVEAGLELKGTEVKSLRLNKVDIKDSFARMERGEVFLHNLYVSPYDKATYNNVDPRRVRKLLLHKAQINKLVGKMAQKGFTLIALSLYFNNTGRVKVELALARGRHLYDQREKIKEKEVQRSLRKVTKLYTR